MSTDLDKHRRDMMPRLRTILRRTRYFPATKEIGGTMVDGKPYPPVPVSAAWTIHSATDGPIGMVLATRWGYRATTNGGKWAGCWHTSRDLCRDWYAKDYFYDVDAPTWRDPAHAALTAAGVPLTFDHTHGLRVLYGQGKTWQEAVASRVQWYQQHKVAWLNDAWNCMPSAWMHDQGVWANLHMLYGRGYTVAAALEETKQALPRLATL